MSREPAAVNIAAVIVIGLVAALIGHFTREKQPQVNWLVLAGIGALLLVAGFAATVPLLGYVGAACLGAGLAGAMSGRATTA